MQTSDEMSDVSLSGAPSFRVKRRHARAPVSATATVFTNRRALPPCVVEDLSAAGVRLATGTAVRRGRIVSLLLDLPGGDPIHACAQVVRTQKRANGDLVMALSFLDLRRAHVERLVGLVAELLAASNPCLTFFDTDADGRPCRIVLTDDAPVVG